MKTVVSGNSWHPHGVPLSNANPVEVTQGSTHSILLHYDTRNNNHDGDSKLMQIWSHDDGNSWGSTAEPVGKDISGYMNGKGNCMPGPSVGVQMSNGNIYFSCHSSGWVFLYWSTDYGSTWKRSQEVSTYDECTIALNGYEVLMNCKTSPGNNARKMLRWSKDGALLETFSASASPGLDDSGTQGSLIKYGGTLYLSNTYEVSKFKRQSLTLKRSKDNGHNWDDGLVIHSGASGYSQLLPSGGYLGMGVIFEFGDVHWDASAQNHYSEHGIGFFSFAVPADNPASWPQMDDEVGNLTITEIHSAPSFEDLDDDSADEMSQQDLEEELKDESTDETGDDSAESTVV